MMLNVEIKTETFKKLQDLAKKSQCNVSNLVEEYISDRIIEDEKINDPDYIQFCLQTEQELEKLEKNPNNPMDAKDFIKELETW